MHLDPLLLGQGKVFTTSDQHVLRCKAPWWRWRWLLLEQLSWRNLHQLQTSFSYDVKAHAVSLKREYGEGV